MSSFPFHKPVCWKLFRNEPLESQNRRAAITKCCASACRDTGKNPLWWDAQKYVDQVVPAEFITPCEIDTTTYRYQVFARPPPIECAPRSLREVTDAAPPIRYNVKRVAVDKPFPPPSFECAGHWAKHQFVLENKEENSAGFEQDSSRNNNARLIGSVISQNKVAVCQDKNCIAGGENLLEPKPATTDVLERSTGSKGIVPVQTGAQFDKECRNERKTARCLNENNSQACPRLTVVPNCYNKIKSHDPHSKQELKNEASNRNLPYQADRKSKAQNLNHLTQENIRGPHMARSQPKLSTSREQNVLNMERGSAQHMLCQDGYTPKDQIDRMPQESSHKSHSNLSNRLTGSAISEDRCGKHFFRNETNLSDYSVSPASSRVSCEPDLKDATQPAILHNASSISSRACSPCSVSTVSLCPSPKKAYAAHRFRAVKRGYVGSGSNLREESVATLLSESKSSPLLIPSVGRARKKITASETVSRQESVASLLSESNHNNNNNLNENSVKLLPTGALQGLFAGSFSDRVENPLCENNNAAASDRYTLQCCPLKSYRTQGQTSYEPEKEKRLCRFHGKHPKISIHQPLALDQVVPIDPSNRNGKHSEDPKELQCTVMTDCRTGRPIESDAGPLMVCEPRQQVTPNVGYGTYKIIGGLQRREAPLPNYANNLRFPPDIEEYNEFIKRCPNFRIGRYDRRDPLNEMLLPSNKSTNLLVGYNIGPYTFCKIPMRKLPALFKPLMMRSELSWSLPSSLFNQ